MKPRGVRPAVLALSLLFANAVHAQTWVAGASGNWNNPANWVGGVVPAPGADVTFTNGTNGPVLNVAVSVGTLNKTAGGTTTISGANSLTIITGINKTGGVLNISANIIIATANESWSFNGGTNTFSGSVSGQSFNKAGTGGILVLSGTNTFSAATVSVSSLRATASTALGTGATTITLAGGNLQLVNGLTLPCSVVASGSENLNLGGATNSIANLSVGTGATLNLNNLGVLNIGALSGTGTILGAVTVTGTLSPGAGGTGTLTTGALTLNAGTNLNFTFGAPTTTTSVTSTGRLTLVGVLNITNSGGMAIGSYPAFAYGSITPGTVSQGAVPAGFSYGVRAAGGTVFVDVGRKPSSAVFARALGEHDGTSARVVWSTAQESQNLGFRIWRDVDGERKVVSPGLIAGFALRSSADLAAGHSYGWEDRKAPSGGTYWIEAIDMQGHSDWSPAITTRPGQAFRGVPSSAAVAKTSTLGSPLMAPVALNAPRHQVGMPSPDRQIQWRLANMPAAQIPVQTQGYYHVTAAQLFSAGIPMGAPVSSLSLWAGSQPVAFRTVSADGLSLQSGDAIEFYGVPLDTYYSGTQLYWLTSGFRSGQQITTAVVQAISQAGASFPETLEGAGPATFTSLPGIALGDRFFSTVIFAGSGFSHSDEESFSTRFLDPISSSTSTISIAIQGLTATPHNITVLLNGMALGSVSGSGVALMTADLPIAPGLVAAGTNTVDLVPQNPSGSAQFDDSGVVYVRLTYPRLFAYSGAPLQFAASGDSSVILTGFPEGTRVLDVTDPLNPLSLSVQADSSGGLLVVAPGAGIRTLYAFSSTDVRTPDAVVANAPSSWHSYPGADLLIIAHGSLLQSLQPLVAQRQAEGFKVAAVDVQDVYDEFANGEKSATALKDFLQYASTHWRTPPSYVLLGGLGTYDPRGYLGHPEYDLLPVIQVETADMFTASDDAYVSFDGQLPAIAIGRLPLRTAADSSTAVEKILGRTLLSPNASLLFVQGAPRYYLDGGVPFTSDDFGADTALAESVVAAWPRTEIAPSDAGVDAEHAELISALVAGAPLVNYEGHGSESTWYPTSPELFSTDDLASLAGTDKTFVVVAATCLNGYFLSIDPNTVDESFAEGLLRTNAGGAWAVWTSTGTTNSTDHGKLSAALLKAAVADGHTLGEATLLAKAAESDPDVRAVFHLFGDPTSRIVPAKPGSTVTLAGSVQAQSASGCGTSGGTALAVLPLVVLALLLNARARRTATVRIHRR